MNVRTIKTRRVTPQCCTIFELLDESVTTLSEGSVVAVASKVVALCEGSVAPLEGTDKDELIAEQASHYLPRSLSRYQVSFAIAGGRLAPSAGIDESNAGGFYILWPRDSQASANAIRAHLRKKFNLQNIGVLVTDSTTRPMQWGTTGVALAHSGFQALHDYVGTLDLFGRPFEFHKNNIAQGLAATTVLMMGEGAEQRPIAIAEDLPFVTFQDQEPTEAELKALEIAPADDLYAPFLQSVPWQQGRGH
jgi:dihydrofolate synthase / folylpolyglutamate synthase